MIEIEIDNRSGVEIDEQGACELARRVLAAEGIDSGELGLVFVGPEESRALKQEHLGIDEATDAIAFPIDALDDLLGKTYELPARPGLSRPWWRTRYSTGAQLAGG